MVTLVVPFGLPLRTTIFMAFIVLLGTILNAW
jgi:hypothetical protein